MSVAGKIHIAERLAALADEMRSIAEQMRAHPENEFHRHATEMDFGAAMADKWAKELECFA